MNTNSNTAHHDANDPIVGRDPMGNPFNKKYPPDTAKYGTTYDGYPTYNQEVFFLDFAIEGYDVLFAHNGKQYFVQIWKEGAAQLDPATYQLIRLFDNANVLVEQMEIDGQKLIDCIDQVQIIELY